MRKFTLFLFVLAALFILPAGLRAQQTLTVNDGTEINNNVPISGLGLHLKYMHSEFVIPASQLGAITDSLITDLTFYGAGSTISSDWHCHFYVYLEEVADTIHNDIVDFNSSSTVISGSDPKLVGARKYLVVSNGELHVVFDKPFHYQGGHLLIGFFTEYEGSWDYSQWYGINAPAGSSVCGSNSDYIITDVTQYSFLPKTTIGYRNKAFSILIDFETNDFSQYSFQHLGQPWVVTTADNGSDYCMRSGNSNGGENTSTIRVTHKYESDGYIIFDANCDGRGRGSSYSSDKCIFSTDYSTVFSYGEEVEGWHTYMFPVGAGDRTFEWKYSKYHANEYTGGSFFVDNIVFGAGTPCVAPHHVTIKQNPIDSTIVNWLGCSNDFTLRYRSLGGTWTTVSGVSGNRYAIPDLAPGDYEVQVSAPCEPDNWASDTVHIIGVNSTANWYGYSNKNKYNKQFVSFSMQNPASITVAYPEVIPDVVAATYADGYVWFVQDNSYDPGKLWRAELDNNSKTFSKFETVVPNFDDAYVKHMSYNPADGKIYYISQSSNYSSSGVLLKNFDPSNPYNITVIGTLDYQYYTFAINSTGEAYGTKYGGDLYRISLADASSTFVGSTNRLTMSVHGMAFDPQTDELFWAQYDYYLRPYNALYLLDPNTAKTLNIGLVGDTIMHITGLFAGDNTTIACHTPQNITAYGVGPYSARLTWEENIAAAGWVIEYDTLTDFSTSITETITTNEYQLTGLAPETTYYVRIKTDCGAGSESVWSYNTFTTAAACPVPGNLTLVEKSSSSFTLAWGSSSNADDWWFAYDTLNNYNTCTYIRTTTPTYTLTNLIPGKIYYVAVMANCGNEGSSKWITGSVTTLEACMAPTGLTASQICDTSMVLTWDATSASEYEISVNGSVVATVNGSTYMLGGLTAETAYEIKVRGNCGSDGYSKWSSPLNIITPNCHIENACEIHYELNDSYGDGWTGNIINVVDTVSGNTIASLTITSGYSLSGMLGVCNGQVIRFEWVYGYYPDETSYVFFDANNDTIFSGSDALNAALTHTVSCPTCTKPSAFTAIQTESDKVLLSWDDNGLANGWVLEYGDAADFSGATSVNVITNSHLLTNLISGKSYYARVKADCGADGESVWNSTVSFVPVLSTADWYGYPCYTIPTASWQNKYIRFTMQNPATITAASPGKFPETYASTYANGYVWFFNENNHDLCRAPLDNIQKTIGMYEMVVPGLESEEVAAMSYNPVDGRIYYVLWSSHKVKSFDPAQPDIITMVGTADKHFVTFAINNAGEAYGIDDNGDLYRVSLTDASIQLVGNTGADVKYSQSMAFDQNTGELFWAQYSSSSDNALYVVNPSTAEVEKLGHVGGTSSEITGLFMVSGVLCNAPTDLTAANATFSSIELSWTENGTATEWQLCLDGDESNPIDITSNPYTLTGLQPNTSHTVKVRANCGAGSKSIWSNKLSFTTEDVTVLSDGNWYAYTTAYYDNWGMSYRFVNFSAQNPAAIAISSDKLDHILGATYANGEVWFYYDDDHNDTLYKAPLDNNTRTIGTPQAVVANNPGYVASMCYNPVDSLIYIIYYTSNMTAKMSSLDPANPNNLTEIGTFSNYPFSLAINSSGEAYCVEVMTGDLLRLNLADASYTTVGHLGYNTYIPFIAFDQNTGELLMGMADHSDTNGLYLVNSANAESAFIGTLGYGSGANVSGMFMVAGSTPCHAPTNLTVSNTTENSADLSWTENGTATDWQIRINGDNNSIMNVTTNPYTLTGLTPEATYTVEVRANCDIYGTSAWSNAVTFISSVFNSSLVEIGSCNSGTANLPSTNNSYSLSQQIYTAAEIGQAGDISSIAFFNEGNSKTCNYDIYLVHTNKTAFDNGADWVSVTASDLVFSGNVEMSTGVWTTIDLDVPFHYNGTGNLLLTIDDNTGSWSQDISFYNFYVMEDQSMVVDDNYSDIDPFDLTWNYGFAMSSKNCIRLNFGTICQKPKNLTYSISNLNGVVLNWESNATSFNVEYKKTTDTQWQQITTTATTATLTGLDTVSYEVRVQAVCDPDVLESDWTTVSFTITNHQPTANWYSFVQYSPDNYDWMYKYVNFSMQELGSVSIASNFHNIFPGATTYANGYIWTTFYDNNYINLDLYRAPLDNINKTIGNYELVMSAFESNSVSSMSYNPVDGRIYYLRDDQKLASFDPAFPDLVTEIGVYNDYFDYITINSSGEAYCLKYDGDFYRMSTTDASVTYIGNIPDAATIAFDQETDELYCVAYSNYGQIICMIDPTTAAKQELGFIGGDTTIMLLNLIKASSTANVCYAPHNINVSSIGMHSATLNWEDNNNVDRWVVEYSTAPDFTGSTTMNVTTNSCTFTGLTSATIYYVRVKTDCGADGESYWTIHSFNTKICEDASQCEISYELEDSYGDGWNGCAINVVDDATGIVFATLTIDTGSTLTSSFAACNGREIRFEWVDGYASYETSYTVYDPEGNVIFSGSDALNAPVFYMMNCPAPSCPAPASLAVSDIFEEEALLSWTENGSATEWQICVNGDETNLIDVTTNPYILNGLNPGTPYTVKVRANCGVDGNSQWCDEVSFTTFNIQSDANWYAYIQSSTDNFEWERKFISFSMQNLSTADTASETIYDYPVAITYANGYVWSCYYDYNGTYINLLRAQLHNDTKTIGNYATVKLGFEHDYIPSMAYNPIDGRIYYLRGDNKLLSFDPSNPDVVTEIGDYTEDFGKIAINGSGEAFCFDTYTENLYRISLTNAATTLVGNMSGIVNIAFDQNTDELFGTAYVGFGEMLYLMDIPTAAMHEIGYIGGDSTAMIHTMFMVGSTANICYSPDNLTFSSIGMHSATLNWDNDNNVDSWVVEYATVPDFSDAASVTVTTNSCQLSGLNSTTNYYVRVKTDCGVNGTSDWTRGSFHTEICPAADQCAITYVLGDIYGDSWNGCAINMVDEATGIVIYTLTMDNGTDSVSGIVPVCDGRDIRFEWVNGDYPEETSYTVYDPDGNIIFSGSDAMSAPVNYMVNCPVPPCPTPTSLTVNDILEVEALLSWTENGSATEWQICVNGDESNLINVTTNSYLLDGLNLGTSYTVKVRANCGVDGTSQWSDEVSFTTLAPPPFFFILGDENICPNQTTVLQVNTNMGTDYLWSTG